MDEVKLLPCVWCEGETKQFQMQTTEGLVVQMVEHHGWPHCCVRRDSMTVDQWNFRRPTLVTDEVVERVVREAAEPWADYHGELPDYDHPLRPVFESGVQYAVELLAKMLHVEDWEICDGTEEFDGDLGGTLLNIVIKTWPADEHGDWIDFRDPKNRIAAMPAIPPQSLGDHARGAQEHCPICCASKGEPHTDDCYHGGDV